MAADSDYLGLSDFDSPTHFFTVICPQVLSARADGIQLDATDALKVGKIRVTGDASLFANLKYAGFDACVACVSHKAMCH